MASCGPSNAQDQLKGHIFRDASLQRESARASSNSPPQAFRRPRQDQSAAEFAAFNSEPFRSESQLQSFEPNFSHIPQSAVPLGAAPDNRKLAPGSDVGYHGPQSSLAPNVSARSLYRPDVKADAGNPNNWASEFQNLSLNSQARSASSAPIAGHDGVYGRQPFLSGYMPGHPMFQSANFASHNDTYSIPQASVMGTTESAAFEAVFADIEESLQNLQKDNNPASASQSSTDISSAQTQTEEAAAGQMTSEVQTEENVVIENTSSSSEKDASAVAETIMNQISEQSSPDLMDKMKNSQFMTLMNKLRTKEVKLDEDETKLVDRNGSIEAYNLPADSSQDWPPQRERLDSITTENMSASMETQQERPSQRRSTRPDGLPNLDDPDTYLRNIQKNLDPRLFQKSPYTSPFREAVKVSRIPLKPSDWEEKYEDWV